jgi:hypothetical protein
LIICTPQSNQDAAKFFSSALAQGVDIAKHIITPENIQTGIDLVKTGVKVGSMFL